MAPSVFGAEVRRLRRQHGWSLKSFARQLPYSPGYLSKIENGLMPPSAGLARACDRVLGTDHLVSLVQPRKRVARHAVPIRPAQLPARVADFVGRTDELARLDDLLATRRDPVVPVVAIVGTAGVGKTALAVRWAHQARRRFPDGQLYLNLRGFSVRPELPAGDALRRVVEALGVPPERVPATDEEKISLFRSLLAERRMLVVLDNARTVEQIWPLVPGVPGCAVLVTSRDQLGGLRALDGARVLSLDRLPQRDAIELLTRVLGGDRARAEPDALAQLAELCAGLPLALRLVAAHLMTHPHRRVADVNARLTHDRLPVLDSTDPLASARTAFEVSYSAHDPRAQRLFRLMGLAPRPDISLAAAARLIDQPDEHTHLLLDELGAAHLITSPVADRFHYHDLLRTYAAAQAGAVDSDADRTAALRRLFDYYVHTAYGADRQLYPQRHVITLDAPVAGARPQMFSTPLQAGEWLHAEQAVLVDAVRQGAEQGFDAHSWRLAWTLVTYLDRIGDFDQLHDIHMIALTATERSGIIEGQAWAHRGLARALSLRGDHRRAIAHFRAALRMFRTLGDQIGQADCHRGIGWVSNRQQRESGLNHTLTALRLYRSAGDRTGEADALNGAGWHHAQLGHYEDALRYCQEALDRHRDLGDDDGLAQTWDSIGYAHQHLGNHGDAVAAYGRAVRLFGRLGDQYEQAQSLVRLGDTHEQRGDQGRARHAWRRALRILDELDHPDAEGVRARITG